jgi:hypothetical protein
MVSLKSYSFREGHDLGHRGGCPLRPMSRGGHRGSHVFRILRQCRSRWMSIATCRKFCFFDTNGVVCVVHEGRVNITSCSIQSYSPVLSIHRKTNSPVKTWVTVPVISRKNIRTRNCPKHNMMRYPPYPPGKSYTASHWWKTRSQSGQDHVVIQTVEIQIVPRVRMGLVIGGITEVPSDTRLDRLLGPCAEGVVVFLSGEGVVGVEEETGSIGHT